MKAWLRKLPRGALKGWLAFDAVEPIGEQWRQTAQIQSTLSQLVGAQYLAVGVELPAQSVDDAMPARYQREKIRKTIEKPQDAGAQATQLAAALGLSEVFAKHGNDNKRG